MKMFSVPHRAFPICKITFSERFHDDYRQGLLCCVLHTDYACNVFSSSSGGYDHSSWIKSIVCLNPLVMP